MPSDEGRPSDIPPKPAPKSLSLPPQPPALHFIATPIGTARDITLRALDLLREVDVLAAEDTRSLRHLMEIHGIAVAGRPLLSYHDHNEAQIVPKLLAALAAGKSVLYASEAGTPLISDPGYGLARAVIDAGYKIEAAPGASAVLCALMVAGLPTDRFFFAGFAPSSKSARRSFLGDLSRVDATLVLYESPKRVREMLSDMALSFGEGRRMVLCRELTKHFEEVLRGSIADILAMVADRTLKGEIVLVIDRAPVAKADPKLIGSALDQALLEMSVKDAAASVADAFSLPRREVYQQALLRTKK